MKPEIVRVAFAQWKKDNNYTCKCVIHHRDDTEETRAYNNAYYERWGCNEDGSFEYGKYVVFMTLSDHNKYHHTGNATIDKSISNALVGRVGAMTNHAHSEETKRKISNAHQGMKHSDSTRDKMELKRQKYILYKSAGGSLKWNDFQRLFANNEPQVMQYLVNNF